MDAMNQPPREFVEPPESQLQVPVETQRGPAPMPRVSERRLEAAQKPGPRSESSDREPSDREPSDPPVPIVTDDGPRIGASGLKPVSPKLIPARYIAGIPGYVIGVLMIAACLVLWWWQGWWWLGLVAVIPAITVVQGLLLTPRRARAIGYLDGEDELIVASGLMFRNVVTVPYGRIQSVKIDEGPVDRSYGLAKISFTTAADAGETLPGLPKEEAERLRELLTRRGIDTMAAL